MKTLKYFIITLGLLFSFLLFNTSIYSSSNYIYIQKNAERNLKSIMKNKLIFLYIHSDTCSFCRKVNPEYTKLSKRYPKIKFVKVKLNDARNYLRRRYHIFGTPHVYLMYNGNIVDEMQVEMRRVGRRYVKSDRATSLRRWMQRVYPLFRNLARYRNIYALTSFNYEKLMKNKTFILYKNYVRNRYFQRDLPMIYSLARKYPRQNFGIAVGRISYNQKFDRKFAKAYSKLSIIQNIDKTISQMSTYRKKYSEIDRWLYKQLAQLSKNHNNTAKKNHPSENKKPILPNNPNTPNQKPNTHNNENPFLFKGRNFHHLKNNLQRNINHLSQGGFAFIYISGCGRDKEDLPVFNEMSKKYPRIPFIEFSKYVDKQYLLDRYASFGAPHIYLMYKGNIISQQYIIMERINGRYQRLSVENSIKKWFTDVYEVVKNLTHFRNITPVTSFNYKKIMRSKRFVLLMTNSRIQSKYKKDIKQLFLLARKFPSLHFAFSSGNVPYNLELDNQFSSVRNDFSIIDNADIVISKFRSYIRERKRYTNVNTWLRNTFKQRRQDIELFKKTSEIKKKRTYLNILVYNKKSDELAQLNLKTLQEFEKKNRKKLSQMRPMMLFYVAINAATYTKRKMNTAIYILKSLYFPKSSHFMRNRYMRTKVYAPVIKRQIAVERNYKIRKELQKLYQYYIK